MITITETAAKKIISNIAKRGSGQGIKVGVKTTGCSGLAYILEYVKEYTADPGTINYAQNGFAVLVDIKHDIYLKNTKVDYVRKGLNEGFDFINPNERDRCGCGESFRI
jgi:iron-sulfur cluster assembly protein